MIGVAEMTVKRWPRVAAEVDRGGAGEVGAGDGDRRCRRRSGPVLGSTPVTRRRGDVGELVGRTRSAEVPPGVVTVTSTVPAACAGEVAVIWVAETTVKVAAAVAAEGRPRWPR